MIDINSAAVQLEVKKELARREFWEYCKLFAPDFYKEDRLFLKDLANKLEWFVMESESQFMVVNMPPRHGKSRTATMFIAWLFGIYGNKLKVMTGSYNEKLSTTFASSVRNVIAEKKTPGVLSYCDVFPNTKIKYGQASAMLWALDGSGVANYLATSPTGTATGFGCNLMVIDDLIKSEAEAYNENHLSKLSSWFFNTMVQRMETGCKTVIIMTRWAKKDLAGYVLNNFDDVVHVNYKAYNDGEMLCEEILSLSDYERAIKNMNKDIALANYQQEPIDVKGRLYTNINTYDEKPTDFDYILNYTDTADTGSDNLCSICYGMKDGYYYILDLCYTKEPMEITEPLVAKMLKRNNVGQAIVESNNGGRGFARNVERELRELGDRHTTIKWFHQNQNKKSRILSNSSSVMKYVLFPTDWMNRYPRFANDLLTYQKEGRNTHDDGPDCLTGVYENPKPKNTWLV